MNTFQISEFKLELFTAKMDKFVKRASKLNIDFGYILVSEETKSYCTDLGFKVYYKVYNFSVWGESPIINGYSFLAKLEPFGINNNLVHSHNSDFDFSNYRTCSLTCEHCNINRNRNFYYLIQNEENNTVKMVGGNCLANYISQPNAEEIAEFYSNFVTDEMINDNEEEDFGRINRTAFTYDIAEFLAYGVATIKNNGYISQKMIEAGQGTISTKEMTLSNFFSTGKDKMIVTEQNKIDAQKMIDFVYTQLSAQTKLTDYEANIIKFIEAKYMKISHAGYIVSIVPLYNRMIEKSIVNENRPVSNFIGNEGEKINNIPVVVTYYNMFETQYGYTHLYRFDNNGNVISYFSSKCLELEVGQVTEIIKATVKTHEVYNGINQTVITRGKMKE